MSAPALGPAGRDWLLRAFIAACVAYGAVFLCRQWQRMLDPYVMEWDARGMLLTVLRYHDSGVLARDLAAERATAMAPIGWRALFWLGTLVANPILLTRLFAFALLGIGAFHGYAFGRRHGGVAAGAAVAVMLCLVPFFWDRISGANPRAFGMPLVLVFLRYASERREGPVLAVLVCCAAFYPPVLLVCAAAWGLVVLVDCVRERRIAPLVRLSLCGLVCGALVAPLSLGVDPRIGTGISLDELRLLRQRANGGLYPMTSPRTDIVRAIHLALTDDTARRWLALPVALWVKRLVVLLAASSLVVGLPRSGLGRVFGALFVATALAYVLARVVAYRLYIPDRVLHYTWVPMAALLLPVASARALSLRIGQRGAVLGPAVLLALMSLANGGMAPTLYGVRDWTARVTPTIRFVSTLPKDALVDASLDVSTYVELYGQRSSLASASSNSPNFGAFAREIERRIAAHYDAYYAPTLDAVRAFSQQEGIDYLVVDERDFGADALARASYMQPWTDRAQRLIKRTPPQQMALAHAPPGAVVFRDGPVVVLDAKKL